MRDDAEGFAYPVADPSACVECGLCERVCPQRMPAAPVPPLSLWVARNPCEDERMASSSGGIFVMLAKQVLDGGGVVFGAVCDEHCEVRHAWADSMEGVRPMMGSKYVQSHLGDAYARVRDFLTQGREVLFTGTPCQVAGLHAFLGTRPRKGLLAVEVLCHGVPSRSVWRAFLAQEYGGAVRSIRFRDKAEGGWRQYRVVARGLSADGTSRDAVLSSLAHTTHPFMIGFLANLYLRPSCHACRFKQGQSHADLTLGDYWAALDEPVPLDDDKGLSVVVVGTQHGQDSLAALGVPLLRTTLRRAQRHNGGFESQARPHPRTAQVLRLDAQRRACVVCGAAMSASARPPGGGAVAPPGSMAEAADVWARVNICIEFLARHLIFSYLCSLN